MTLIKPILQRTTGCAHGDETHIGIERFESNDRLRPYLAIETCKCKICGELIEKHWLTAYKNYTEGVNACG